MNLDPNPKKMLPDGPAFDRLCRDVVECPAQRALRAIVARVEGRFDDPALLAFGPLTNTTNDVREIARRGLAS